MLELMLGWYIGTRTDYSVSCGKLNKYFKRYLPDDIYRLYLQTFPDSSYEHFRQAIKSSCILFRQAAVITADSLGIIYPEDYENGFMKYTEVINYSLSI